MSTLRSKDEACFPRPNEYLPERWLRDKPYGDIHPYASLPFSHGSRMCIGRRIAEQEMYIFLARVRVLVSLMFLIFPINIKR